MREIRVERAAELRQRAEDLRIELKKRPHLVHTLWSEIEKLRTEAERLDGKLPENAL